MDKEQIVFDWLKLKANRDKLKTKEVSFSTFEAFMHYGHVYKFEDDLVGTLGNKILILKKKDEASKGSDASNCEY